MAEPIDLNQRRFDKAESCADITAASALREALRSVESGEWPITSVIIIGLIDDKINNTHMDCVHGGNATTNDRIAMTVRATHMLVNPA